jgi:hypothetical protein
MAYSAVTNLYLFILRMRLSRLGRIRDKAERECDVRLYQWTFIRANELGKKYLGKHRR